MNEIAYKSLGTPIKSFRKNNQILKKCYLCNKELTKESRTEEHVFPRMLFGENLPDHYIKLAACKECNQKKKTAEESILPTLSGMSLSPKTKPIFVKFAKSVNKGHHKGIASNILKNIQTVMLKTESGILLGTTRALKLDPEYQKRINEYIIMLAKGLHVYNLEKFVDWDEFEVHFKFDQLYQSKVLKENEPFKQVWHEGPYGGHWDGCVFYKGYATEEAGMWLFCIYESFIACVTFARKDLVQHS